MTQPELVFWQNALSIHQAPLIRALTKNIGARVMVVVPREISESRHAMGWRHVDYGEADVRLVRSRRERRKIVEATRNARGHVFSGLGSYPEVDQAFVALVKKHHGKIAIFTEPWNPRGWRSVFRKLRYRIRLWRRDRHIDTYFLTGDVAVSQFLGLGIASTKLAEFGYFISVAPSVPRAPKKDQFRLVYVASFEPRKNALNLIRALSQLTDLEWRLTMVGRGAERAKVIDLVRTLHLEHRISFIPRLENSEVQKLLGENDLLVLPSTFDGWGVVVNESLMSGTPVVASAACGSSALLHSTLQGDVFDPENVDSLAWLIRKRIESGPVELAARSRLRTWAAATISPEVAASYLWDRINLGSRARPPWAIRND